MILYTVIGLGAAILITVVVCICKKCGVQDCCEDQYESSSESFSRAMSRKKSWFVKIQDWWERPWCWNRRAKPAVEHGATIVNPSSIIDTIIAENRKKKPVISLQTRPKFDQMSIVTLPNPNRLPRTFRRASDPSLFESDPGIDFKRPIHTRARSNSVIVICDPVDGLP